MNTTKTLEQLKAEAAAAAEAVAAAERAEQERSAAEKAAAEKRKAQEELQRQAAEPVSGWPLKQYVMFRDIVNATKAIIAGQHKDGIPGLTLEVTEPRKKVVLVDESVNGEIKSVGIIPSSLNIELNGEKVYVRIRWDNAMEGGSWRPRPTGKLLMKVGDYGDTKVYPQRKDGSFNYEGAALHVWGNICTALRQQELAAAKKSNAQQVKALREEFGLGEYSEVVRASFYDLGSHGRGRDYVAPEGQLYFKFGGTFTPEQCRAAIIALRAAGFEVK